MDEATKARLSESMKHAWKARYAQGRTSNDRSKWGATPEQPEVSAKTGKPLSMNPKAIENRRYRANKKLKAQAAASANLHWTQRPENRGRVLEITRKASSALSALSMTPGAIAQRARREAARQGDYTPKGQSMTPRAIYLRKRDQLMEQYGVRGLMQLPPEVRAQLKASKPLVDTPEAAYKRQWYQQNKAKHRPIDNGLPAKEAVPCSLPACPECGAKFYIVRGVNQ